MTGFKLNRFKCNEKEIICYRFVFNPLIEETLISNISALLSVSLHQLFYAFEFKLTHRTRPSV